MKINLMDLKTSKIGDQISGALLVVTSCVRKTKTQKDYLAITLTDGTTKTSSNVWNWTSKTIPQPNDVVDIVGSVSEYNGARQLNIDTVKRSTVSVVEFAPDGGFNIPAYCERFLSFASSIKDPFLSELTIQAFNSQVDLWMEVPGALSVHNDYVAGCLQHSVDVCNNALAMYANYSNLANVDLVIAGALLHDVGKLYTYKLNGAIIEMTDQGQLFDHPVIGAKLINRLGSAIIDKGLIEDNNQPKLDLLEHIILSHHGKLEYGAPVTPKCTEAMIVNYADGMDAKMRTYETACKGLPDNSMWTEKIFFFENRPMLTTEYINKVFNK